MVAEGARVSGVLVEQELVQAWRGVGVRPGMHLVVHSSLSSLGEVAGGAQAMAASLLQAVGTEGTVVVPAFTPQVSDPLPHTSGVPDGAAARPGR